MAETFPRPRSRRPATCRNVWPKQQGNCSYGFKLEKPAGQAGAYRTQVGLGHVFPSERSFKHVPPKKAMRNSLSKRFCHTKPRSQYIHLSTLLNNSASSKHQLPHTARQSAPVATHSRAISDSSRHRRSVRTRNNDEENALAANLRTAPRTKAPASTNTKTNTARPDHSTHTNNTNGQEGTQSTANKRKHKHKPADSITPNNNSTANNTAQHRTQQTTNNTAAQQHNNSQTRHSTKNYNNTTPKRNTKRSSNTKKKQQGTHTGGHTHTGGGGHTHTHTHTNTFSHTHTHTQEDTHTR